MATSGTVGKTTLDVATILEHAFRRVRVHPSEQTPETVQSATESLYMLLVNLANRGLNLWCVQSSFIGLANGQSVYQMPTGTIDVLNVTYCQPTRATGTDTVDATSTATDLGAATPVRRIGLKFSTIAASDTVTIESSDDGVTWATLKAETSTEWATDSWYWNELSAITTARYFRVSTASNSTASEFYLATQSADLPVTIWNRDTWAVINNKAQQGRPSTNYYYERLLTPQVTLWPVPNNNYDHLQVFYQRQIQDIGALTNEVEIPTRWAEGIIWQLAARLAFELPKVDPGIIPNVMAMADKVLIEVEHDEGDGAPIALQPGIRVYTR